MECNFCLKTVPQNQNKMYKLIFILSLLIITLQSYGQVFISGEIKNVPKGSAVDVTYDNNAIDWVELSAGKTETDENGKFTLTIKLAKSQKANLSIGDQYTEMFLVPGDSLHVVCDYSDFDSTLYYTGKGAADNNYLAAESLQDYDKKANRYSFFSDAEQYKRYEDSLETANNEFLKSHDSPLFSNAFRNYITTTTKYRYINPRWMFKITYDKATKKITMRDLPEEYFSFLKTIDLNEQQSSENTEYSVAVDRYINEVNDAKVRKTILDTITEIQKNKMLITQNYNFRKSILKGRVLDYQLTTFLKNTIGRFNSDRKFMDELIEDYKTVCKNPEYIAIIDENYARANKLSAGKPSPDFALLNMDGNIVSLSSLKGKVVFIDYWATWCVPCIVAMPVTHKLIEKFKDNKDVVFLNVNVNDDFTKWKNFVTKEKMSGENLYANKEQSDNLYKSYNIIGIPHYVLIDKQGKMIETNADNTVKTENKITIALNQ